MRAPSVKSLLRIEGMDADVAKRLRGYIHGDSVPFDAKTSGWDRNERILRGADIAIGAHGVEYIWDDRLGDPSGCWGHPRLAYINMGDTYDATLLYDYTTRTFRVGCWGDVAERLGDHLL
jgi:hypothetical protein